MGYIGDTVWMIHTEYAGFDKMVCVDGLEGLASAGVSCLRYSLATRWYMSEMVLTTNNSDSHEQASSIRPSRIVIMASFGGICWSVILAIMLVGVVIRVTEPGGHARGGLIRCLIRISVWVKAVR